MNPHPTGRSSARNNEQIEQLQGKDDDSNFIYTIRTIAVFVQVITLQYIYCSIKKHYEQ